ncbi:MAG TPA: peptidase T [Thermoguttaceae bacterium]|nr:peptidase T [Thermoguttaceae bacterium]
MNRQRLLDRFLRYVKIDTTARDEAKDYPSCPGQLELGRLLVEELAAMGIDDARQDEHGIILATVPATVDAPSPVIAWCAHLDTSPETSGRDVKPQVIDNYPGGDLSLPGHPDRVIRVAENPELDGLVGKTLITTDGTTLLGADDKAGIAVIMEAAQWLLANPEIQHGPVRLCFTCDEEVGRGVDKLDLQQIGAAACYTLDGQGQDTIDVETFSADLATVTVHGKNIHPSIAKDRMTNAIRAAADFLDRLPRDHLSPETTEDREGFLHPYEMEGGVAQVKIKVLLREFDATKLQQQADLLKQAADATMAQFPGASIEIAVRPQYRNMAEGLINEPRAVAFAEKALQQLGRTAERTIVRGGTDGSRLTELGLPTPNLATGQHTPHSPLEWACLDEMVAATEWLVALAEVWTRESEHSITI